MLEFLLDFGLAMVTLLKNTCSWEYSSVTSLPRKILATNVPPSRSTCVVMFSAARRSCA